MKKENVTPLVGLSLIILSFIFANFIEIHPKYGTIFVVSLVSGIAIFGIGMTRLRISGNPIHQIIDIKNIFLKYVKQKYPKQEFTFEITIYEDDTYDAKIYFINEKGECVGYRTQNTFNLNKIECVEWAHRY